MQGSKPNRLWVADITFVRTWQGFCYTAFVTDVCTRKIVVWAVSATMRTEDLPVQVFNHAVWQSNSDLEPPRHVRRLQFLERMGSCQVVHRGG
ncbi:DDE-type integrase/transposase/recombinase, partial [Mycobacterium tuberculosis]